MATKSDILICYVKEDNQPYKEGAKGWVTNFHKFLSNLLDQISGKHIKIDLVNEEKITTVDLKSYKAVIVIGTKLLKETVALADVVSGYFKELKKSNDLYSDGVSRIFKVHKRPETDETDLEVLHDLIAYDFYLVDPLTGDAQEFTKFFGNDAERSYWMKMIDMAYDINQILDASAPKPGSDSKDNTVYLASTGRDLMIQRDNIKRELIRHGYKVLPQHSLPRDLKSLEKVVKEDLQKSKIAIHMVGEDYGFKPKESEISVVDIQNRLAATHLHEVAERKSPQNTKEFSRLVWVSPDLKNITERQKIFIEDLKSDAALLEDAEVLQIPLSEFKSIIREELVTGGRFNVLREHRGEFSKGGQQKVIYVIHDRKDQDESKELKSFLKSSGYEVVAPLYEGKLSDIRSQHQENLRKCDGSIIYFGKSKEDWIKTKLQDLLKAPGFGREKQLLAKAVYCVGQKEIDTMYFERNNAMVLGNNGSFKTEHLKPFLSKIEAK